MAGDSKKEEKVSFKGVLIALIVGGVITLVVAEVALRLLMPNWSEFDSARFMQSTVVPGHGRALIGRPGFDGYFSQNNGDFRSRIRINAFGLRNPEPVESANDRIWVIGDSMAFGWGVHQKDTYAKVVERETGHGTYIVAGPGNDLCGYHALAARMPSTVRPRAVVVGLIVENDVHLYDCLHGKASPTAAKAEEENSRLLPTLSEVKYFLTGTSALYNFLAVTAKRVRVVNEVLATLGLVARPHTFRAAFETDNAEGRAEGTAAEVDYLRSMFPKDMPFMVVVCPARFDIRDNDPSFAELRRKTIAALHKRGIATIDPTEALKSSAFGNTHFLHDGHWSALGHKLVGGEIVKWVKKELG